MSIDDDYFEIYDAIDEGTFPEEWASSVSRILDALSNQEKLTIALQDQIRELESEQNKVRWNKAELEHEIKTLKKRLKYMSKES